MALTRAQVEKKLVNRCKGSMEFVGFAVTDSGSNADLNEPICTALLKMGLTVANIDTVADADLAVVPQSDLTQLLDTAELCLLRNIQGNVKTVDTTADSQTERYSQFADKIAAQIKQLENRIAADYGSGAASLSAGKISYGFQAKET